MTSLASSSSRSDAKGTSDAWLIPAGQVLVGILLLALWELAGRQFGSTWTSQPSLIFVRLYKLIFSDVYWHILITTTEIVVGLALGAGLGIAVGLLLGYSMVLGIVLRPIVVVLYNIPLVTLIPLFIFWLGFGILSKIVLIAISVFFIVFFNVFTGATQVDHDTLQSVETMGATPREQFQKVVFPACIAWISAGMKISLPYALVAATTGEMLAAREGLGWMLARSAAQFDMTGVYTVLFILMLMGMMVAEAAMRLETFLLRWRHAGE